MKKLSAGGHVRVPEPPAAPGVLRLAYIAVLTITVFAWASPAQAMHLSEGILPANWAAFWFLASAPFVFWGLRNIQRRRAEEPQAMPMVALVGAAIFVISCMPVPIPVVGSCSHPCGTGLGALVIGPGPTIVVASIALLFQALFLAHGGLTTWGANIFSMGVMGALTGWLIFRGLRAMRVPLFAAAFAAGLLSDWATYATTSLELTLSSQATGSQVALFLSIAVAFMPTQIPLGIAEGVVTAVAYRFVLARRPDLLGVRRKVPSVAGADV